MATQDQVASAIAQVPLFSSMEDSPIPIPMIPTSNATGHPNPMSACDEERLEFGALSYLTGPELESFFEECDCDPASESVRRMGAQAAIPCAGYSQNSMPEIPQPVAVQNAAPGFGLSGAVQNAVPGFGPSGAVQNAYVERQKVGPCIVSTIKVGPCKLGPCYNQGKGHQSKRDLQMYKCGYCSAYKVSASTANDCRVRIRCSCGGQSQDGNNRMHTRWNVLPSLSAAIVAHPHTIVDASMSR